MKKSSDSRGRGRPRDAAKESAIIDAAMHMFLEHGFDGVSVDAIAEAAGVAKATIYARFVDKEGLLKAAVALKCPQVMDSVIAESSAKRNVRQGLIAIGKSFLNLITDRKTVALFRLIIEEGQRGPQLPRLLFEAAILPTHSQIVTYLEAETKRGRLKIDDVGTAAWHFLSMIKGEPQMRALLGLPQRPAAELDAHVASCVDMFLRAYAP